MGGAEHQAGRCCDHRVGEAVSDRHRLLGHRDEVIEHRCAAVVDVQVVEGPEPIETLAQGFGDRQRSSEVGIRLAAGVVGEQQGAAERAVQDHLMTCS